ncbi:MAG: (2Fe-2S)-binding protein [Rhodospirillaceae bacterium]|nr:(2Fe-2S)-binding protein [Rhodospirillaceae bacterium]|tara:strand:- start:610 stop:1080 length:471 start_codon:yes stop_codon:yes gene_type:complete
MKTTEIVLNGETRSVSSVEGTPLIYVLRNDLNLTGAKLGCGLEQCGACMVLVDGEPTFSCTQTVEEFEGCVIETIEGLGNPEQPSLIQKIFAEENAAQCGYCTAGVIVSISGLFAKNPKPTDKQVKEVLCRHLCRCGSHPRILAAIEKLRGEKRDE